MRAFAMLAISVNMSVWATVPVVSAQSNIPVVSLGAPEAISTHRFGKIIGVRPLTDGRVLINDGEHRQLLVLSSDLSNVSILLDSVAGSSQSYGPVATPIIPYLSDSSLFVDGASGSLLLISPSGTPVRAIAPPKVSDMRRLSFAMSGVDARGDLIYLGSPPLRESKNGELTVAQAADSAPLLRANFDTRRVDTIARLKTATGTRSVVSTAGARTVNTMTINPLWAIDGWAVLSTGAIAVVRARDYSVEIIHPNGQVSLAGKLPYAWKRLSDNDKQLLIDSARTAREKAQAEATAREVAQLEKGASPANSSSKVAGSYSLVIEYVAIKEIPDYWPPLRVGAITADLEGNLWILPSTSEHAKNGEVTYDVVNGDGKLVRRIRIPAGRSIAGFGHGGMVFLVALDGRNGWVLERSRVPSIVP